MPTVSYILLGFYIVFLSLYIIQKLRCHSLKSVFLKTVTSLLFIALAIYHTYLKGMSLFALMILLGFIFALLGDIFLALKHVYKSEEKPFTLAGIISFALCHIFFIVGLFNSFYINGHPLAVILPFIFGLFVSIFLLLLEKIMKLHYGKMKIIIFSYSFLLYSMVGTSWSLLILSNFKLLSLLLMSIGAVLFAASDMLLCRTYFGKTKHKKFYVSANSVLYYGAQAMIAFAILMLGVLI